MTGNPLYLMVPVTAGTPTVGLWCPRCLVCTGFKITLYALFIGGVSPVGTKRMCKQCLHPIPDEEND